MISEYIDQVLDIYYLDTENQSVYNQDLDDSKTKDQRGQKKRLFHGYTLQIM